MVTKKGNDLLLVVSDDGIGRKKAMDIKNQSEKSHKSRATEIIKEKVDTLNAIKKEGIKIETRDVKNGDGEVGGTRVEIWLLNTLYISG